MTNAELIYEETKTLPEALTAEVLDFIAFLKSRHVDTLAESLMMEDERDIERRKSELLASFSRFQIDMSDFKFDREEANARR